MPYATLDRKAEHLRLLRTLADRADLIVTVSESSKADLIELLGVDEKRVVNTYQPAGIPEAYLKTPADELAASLHGVFGLEPGRYVLAYGAVEPKKNFGRLIEAFLAANLEIPLIIVGPDGWLADRELALLDEERQRVLVHEGEILRIKRPVRRLGYVPFRQLVHLIRGAACVAFPSLYEGFGLPILEAMHCGTPVLTSNRGATAEIAGDAAVLVDPYRVDQITRGLRELCLDPARGEALVERGHRRKLHFSPDACARRLADAYATLGLPRGLEPRHPEETPDGPDDRVRAAAPSP
jgi:glycosyltransferase involved in cell wall biosynthesis